MEFQSKLKDWSRKVVLQIKNKDFLMSKSSFVSTFYEKEYGLSENKK